MSKRCPSLDGTEHYAYSTRVNPPTRTQRNLIKIIEDNLGVKFNGQSSKQAYEFIGKYYEKAKRRGRY
jgi:hypothetical protein